MIFGIIIHSQTSYSTQTLKDIEQSYFYSPEKIIRGDPS
jgi:hypothetical protein